MSADAARREVLCALEDRPEVFSWVLVTDAPTPWRRGLWRSADGLRVQSVVFAVRWGHG